jgi:hypothetical protein
MPKRKAKRPVGRPKKSKVQPSAEGKVFPVDYGAMRINLYPKEGEESVLYVEEMLPRFIESLNAAQKKVDDIVQQKSSDHSVSLLERNELQECSIMLELLRNHVLDCCRKIVDGEEIEPQLRYLAIAFTAGQLAVIAPRRQYEADYVAGQKTINALRGTARSQEIEPPSTEELSDFINAELARHGQKTLAIKKAASYFAVSPNTVRNWIKRKGLEFTK